jgi:hypothetical protein
MYQTLLEHYDVQTRFRLDETFNGSTPEHHLNESSALLHVEP